MRMNEQGYEQSDMEEFDSMALGRKNYVATLEERRCCRDQYKVVQPNEEHPEHKYKLHNGKRRT